MSSSNPQNSGAVFNPKIKIKSEFNSTAANLLNQTNNSSDGLIANIKTEPGLPSTSGIANVNTTRLLSFKKPRDLTLGGNIKLEKPRKVYTPNLNVQRLKDREDSSALNKNEGGPKTGNRNKARGREHSDRGKARCKPTNNLVQSAGIFSEGLADISSRNKRYGIGYGRERDCNDKKDSVATMQKPKLNLNQKVDKAEEARKLKKLMRDDFINDGVDVDLDNNVPIGLPMFDNVNLFKDNYDGENKEIDISIDASIALKSVQNGSAKSVNGSTVKLRNSKTKVNEPKLPITVPQVIDNKSSTFILFQLPDCLPGITSDDKLDERQSNANSNEINETKEINQNSYATLNNLKEGSLGKLQILRSGMARLVLGENNLIVDVGTNVSFRQDVIATKISNDKKSGELVNLGTVSSTLICSPDWENMLKKI